MSYFSKHQLAAQVPGVFLFAWKGNIYCAQKSLILSRELLPGAYGLSYLYQQRPRSQLIQKTVFQGFGITSWKFCNGSKAKVNKHTLEMYLSNYFWSPVQRRRKKRKSLIELYQLTPRFRVWLKHVTVASFSAFVPLVQFSALDLGLTAKISVSAPSSVTDCSELTRNWIKVCSTMITFEFLTILWFLMSQQEMPLNRTRFTFHHPM